jgi:hypothetical protein
VPHLPLIQEKINGRLSLIKTSLFLNYWAGIASDGFTFIFLRLR